MIRPVLLFYPSFSSANKQAPNMPIQETSTLVSTAVSTSRIDDPIHRLDSICSFYYSQKKLTKNHLMFHKNHQYQHTSGDPTFLHRHRTRERSNPAKQVLQAGRTGCRFVWTVSRISERSPGEFVLCRPVRTSEAHRVFP